MIFEYIIGFLKKICCCNIIIIKGGKFQKIKNKRNVPKNFKEYTPVSISENENEKSEKTFKIPTLFYIILSIILFCLIIYFCFKIYNIIIGINKNKNQNQNVNKKENEKEENAEKEIRVCVCTLGKKENRYIREFVQHYENYGVDKIFLYDNNDVDGEKFDDILNDFIQKGFVELLNWRGKYQAMMKIMNDCYQRNYETYDWIIFFELDEFIHLSNYSSVKPFLNLPRFKECQVIYLNLICHTDNNLLYYDNRSLAERFPKMVPKHKKGGYRLEIKSIVRGHIPNLTVESNHLCNKKLINCNGYGNSNRYYYDTYTNQNDYKNFYIDHYYSKSTEEFIDKLTKGDSLKNNIEYQIERVSKYFSQSEITHAKLNFIENKTGLNLSIYRKKAKKL